MTLATAIVQQRPDTYQHAPSRPDTDHHGPYGPSWHTKAACRDADPSLFISPCSSSAWRPICDRCSVAEVCLWAALAEEADGEYRYGVRGGCTAARRQRIVESLPPIDFHAALQAAVDAGEAR